MAAGEIAQRRILRLGAGGRQPADLGRAGLSANGDADTECGEKKKARQAGAQLRPAKSPRAMTPAWISAAPSKMLRMRASQSTRLISNSIA